MFEIYATLENVIVQFITFLRHMRSRKTESFTKPNNKELIIGEL